MDTHDVISKEAQLKDQIAQIQQLENLDQRLLTAVAQHQERVLASKVDAVVPELQATLLLSPKDSDLHEEARELLSQLQAAQKGSEEQPTASNTPALLSQWAKVKEQRRSLLDHKQPPAGGSPTLLVVGVTDRNMLAFFDMGTPDHVAFIPVENEVDVYEHIKLTWTTETDFGPHNFRIVASKELCHRLKQNVTSLTMAPEISCHYYLPAADKAHEGNSDESRINSLPDLLELIAFS